MSRPTVSGFIRSNDFVVTNQAGTAESSDGQCIVLGDVSNAPSYVRDGNDADDVTSAFERNGPKGLLDIDGSFVAILMFEGSLYLCAGKSPTTSLYWSRDSTNQRVWFSSDLASFPQHVRDNFRPLADCDEQHWREDPTRTMLIDVQRVVAGTVLQFDVADGSVEIHTYHDMSHEPIAWTDADVHQRLRDALTAAVAAGHGRRATCLVSGGLDSSIVALLAAQSGSELDLVSIGTDERNEFDHAAKVGRLIDRPVRNVVVHTDHWEEHFARTVLAAEHSFSMYLEYLLPIEVALDAIAPQTDVLMGYGSDVLFGGFAQPGQSAEEVERLIRHEYRSALYANELSQLFWPAANVRCLAPFFDSAVVELALSIPVALKHRDNVEKAVLREAFAELLGPDLAWRKKVGVHEATGVEDWFSHQLGAIDRDIARRQKDAVAHEVLRLGLVENIEPSAIAVDTIIRQVKAS